MVATDLSNSSVNFCMVIEEDCGTGKMGRSLSSSHHTFHPLYLTPAEMCAQNVGLAVAADNSSFVSLQHMGRKGTERMQDREEREEEELALFCGGRRDAEVKRVARSPDQLHYAKIIDFSHDPIEPPPPTALSLYFQEVLPKNVSSGKTSFLGGNTVFFGTGCAGRKHS